VVALNEVYPEPGKSEVAAIKEKKDGDGSFEVIAGGGDTSEALKPGNLQGANPGNFFEVPIPMNYKGVALYGYLSDTAIHRTAYGQPLSS